MNLFDILLAKKLGGGGGGQIEELNVTQNGTYSEAGKSYSPVNVNVQPNLTTKNITQNGTYSASSDNADGYSEVTVNVGGYDVYGNVNYSGSKFNYLRYSIKFPNIENINEISSYSFQNEKSLISVELSENIKTIGNNAFIGCSNLVNFDLLPTVTQLGVNVFNGDNNLISDFDLRNITNLSSCNSLFSGCIKIKNVILPESLTTIPRSMFSQCFGIKSINLPEQLTTIADSAFMQCTGLTSIDLPSRVSSLASQAFINCTGLTSITCRNTTPPTIQANTFSGVPADCAIYVPAGSVNAYKTANYWSARASYIQAIPS